MPLRERLPAIRVLPGIPRHFRLRHRHAEQPLALSEQPVRIAKRLVTNILPAHQSRAIDEECSVQRDVLEIVESTVRLERPEPRIRHDRERERLPFLRLLERRAIWRMKLAESFTCARTIESTSSRNKGTVRVSGNTNSRRNLSLRLVMKPSMLTTKMPSAVESRVAFNCENVSSNFVSASLRAVMS